MTLSQAPHLACLLGHALPGAALVRGSPRLATGLGPLPRELIYFGFASARSRSSRFKTLPLALRGSGSSRSVKKSGTL